MDQQLIAQKLESLRFCVERVESRAPQMAADLAIDLDAQDIVTLNLSRAVQLCVDIAAHILSCRSRQAPATMGESFDQLCAEKIIDADLSERMKKAVGFRNIAVHSYEVIDWQIVHAITAHHLDDFRQYAGKIAALIQQ